MKMPAVGTAGPWGMSGMALPAAPPTNPIEPIPWRGEGALQLGETQGDPDVPGQDRGQMERRQGVGDGRWLSAPWPLAAAPACRRIWGERMKEVK